MATDTQPVHRRDGTDQSLHGIGERMLLFASWWTDLWRWDTPIFSARSTKIVFLLQLRAARPSRWATYQQVRSSTSLSVSIGSRNYLWSLMIDRNAALIFVWELAGKNQWDAAITKIRSNSNLQLCTTRLTFLVTTLWTLRWLCVRMFMCTYV